MRQCVPDNNRKWRPHTPGKLYSCLCPRVVLGPCPGVVGCGQRREPRAPGASGASTAMLTLCDLSSVSLQSPPMGMGQLQHSWIFFQKYYKINFYFVLSLLYIDKVGRYCPYKGLRLIILYYVPNTQTLGLLCVHDKVTCQ